MRAEIISVGTELLLGDILNTNARFLSQELAALGFSVYNQTVVGDNAARLANVVAAAKANSDIIVLSGGLGPTADDLTKETVAEVFGDSLELDPDVLETIESYFRAAGKPMTDNNRKQAMRPRRGGLFANPNGTAPGVYFRQNGKYAILLPGPPREMEPMFLNEVRPLLENLQDASIRSVTLRVFGIGESELETKVAELLENRNPTAALYAKTGEVHIRITARSQNAGQAEMMCREYALMFRRILGNLVYSDDGADLETAVVRILVENGDQVAIAESCTGGLLGERLTSVPGSSAVFGFGAITYANDTKHQLLGVRNSTLRRYGAVSSQTAAEMAFGAQRRGHADFGVAITGIAGPGGGTPEKPVGLVYIAVASGNHVYVRKLYVRNRSRDVVRALATQHALDMLRRVASALPMPGAKLFSRMQQADYDRVGAPRPRWATAGRLLAAALLVAGVFFLVILGIYFTRGGGATGGEGFPSEQGLAYGTEDYARAANHLVESAKQQNPSVTGFVAMPGGTVEQLVAEAHVPQAEVETQLDLAGTENMAVVSADAKPGVPMQNPLLMARKPFTALNRFLDTTHADELTTFTFYNEHYTMEYRIFAVYVADGFEKQPDGFEPEILDLSGYTDYMTYAIGARARSLYDVPVDVAAGDSYMTLATPDPSVPGRVVYLCGRLAHAEEAAAEAMAAPAGNPLYPDDYYKKTGAARPDEAALFEGWTRWFLQDGVDNEELVFRAGMPQKDNIPLVPVESAPAQSVQVSPASGSSAAAMPYGALIPRAGAEQPAGSTGDSAGASQEASASSNADSAQQGGSSSNAGDSAEGSVPGSSSAENAGPSSESAAESGASSGSAPETLQVAPTITEEEKPEEVAAAPPSVPMERPDPRYLTVTMNGVVVRDTTESILAQICQSEAAWCEPEVIKAVAVAAHTWILNQQGAGVAAPEVAGLVPNETVREAVGEVAQFIVTADGETPAFTPWFFMAAKGTNASENTFGFARPYLPGVSSGYDQDRNGWRTIVTLKADVVASILAPHIGVDAKEFPDPAGWFTDIERDDNGYVTKLTVFGQAMTGTAFWHDYLARDGAPLMQSPAFEIDYTSESFVFTSYGRGHGCGLSVVGAVGDAAGGKSYADILANYFPDTTLTKWE